MVTRVHKNTLCTLDGNYGNCYGLHSYTPTQRRSFSRRTNTFSTFPNVSFTPVKTLVLVVYCPCESRSQSERLCARKTTFADSETWRQLTRSNRRRRRTGLLMAGAVLLTQICDVPFALVNWQTRHFWISVFVSF